MLTESRIHPSTRLLLSLLLCGALSGCAIAYLAQATQGQWRLMRARRPIDQVLADPASSAELRATPGTGARCARLCVSELACRTIAAIEATAI